MANEKISDDEILSDGELEDIGGGTYVYYAAGEKNGVKGYHVLLSRTQLHNKGEIINAFNNSKRAFIVEPYASKFAAAVNKDAKNHLINYESMPD